MRPRLAIGCALVLAAVAPGFAQDLFEPNASLARLSADDAYARTSARSLRDADIGEAVAIRLDDAGRVLLAGGSRVARLDVDGQLDPTFGAAGVAELPVWPNVASSGLEIDAAGRIVVTGSFHEAGTYGPSDPGYTGRVYGAARLLADGSLDPAFSDDGLLELDRASGLQFLGPVRASGGDGAMLAVAEKPGPDHGTPVGLRYDTLVGLVRIAADGTLDATYGGGFAQIAQGPSADSFSALVDSVTDFAVDSAGRTVVAVKDIRGSGFTVQRLDIAGGIDPTFWSADYLLSYDLSDSNFTASQVGLDGAGRIIGLDGGRLLRRLPDGAPDRTFSSDGSSWGLEAAGFPGSMSAYQELWALMRSDPDFDPVSETGLLAVATRADRWVLAKPVMYHDAKGRRVGGIRVQTIDPADPGAIVSTIARSPGRRFTRLVDLAVAPDGATAYALGGASVLRIDLAAPKALPLPDLRVKWLGWPHAVDFGRDRYRVTAKVRIRNLSRHAAAGAYGFVGLGDGGEAIPLVGPAANGSRYSWPFRVRARSSVVKRFSWEGKSGPVGLAGARLSIQVACELPDANLADNTATSPQITPLYAPR